VRYLLLDCLGVSRVGATLAWTKAMTVWASRFKGSGRPWVYTPSRAFCAPRKRPDCVTHVSGKNCHPSLRKGIGSNLMPQKIIEVRRRYGGAMPSYLDRT
jgi:hypothetical protein